MLHPDLVVKEFTVKDKESFRLRVKTWECISPKGLNAIHFIQETKDSKGEVEMTATYDFFMTKEELKILVQGLSNV
jgi:hypothetical protein